jgi:alpha-1,2-mannosyltransferase
VPLVVMSPDVVLAYIVFGGYFALIFLSFFLVFKSVLHAVPASRLLEGRPFFFLRTAVGALLCTWYCECPRFATPPASC